MANTCIYGHICNARCYDDVHADIGYDTQTYLPLEERVYSTIHVQRLQEVHDRHCPFPLPHELTVISIEKAREAPNIEVRFPTAAEREGFPFLLTYRWKLTGADHAKN